MKSIRQWFSSSEIDLPFIILWMATLAIFFILLLCMIVSLFMKDNNIVITPTKWNKLSEAEKKARTDSFIQHIKMSPPQTPVDWSYLTRLAVIYQTPVPKYNNGKTDWGEYI